MLTLLAMIFLITPAASTAITITPIQAAVATSTPARAETTVAPPPSEPQEASTDYLIKIPPIDGEDTKKGNVEYEWKVEKGEKATSIEPDEIDLADESEPFTPDFGVLLGGGIDIDDDGDLINTKTEDGRRALGALLLEGALVLDAPVESILVKTNKIEAITIKQRVRLFGVISLSMSSRVEIDERNEVSVHYPWWAFLASGKDDKEVLGLRVYETISNVLKTKHDTVKNSINNIR